MRKIMFLIFLFVSSYIFGQSNSYFGRLVMDGNLKEINWYLNGDGAYKFRAGLFLLNDIELRILRNSIYAKYGYIFKSRDLQEHFSRFSWYNGTKSNVEADLTDEDKENVRIIQAIESNYPASLTNDILVGYWVNVSYKGGIKSLYEEQNWKEIESDEREEIYWLPFISMYPNGTFYMHDGVYGLWQLNDDGYTIYTYLEGPWSIWNSSFQFDEILSPSGKKYLRCKFFRYEDGNWIKIHNTPGYYDK